jgi:hypothetical protein
LPEQQPLEPGLEIARQLTGGSAFASAIFWWGLLCLFALQVAAVFTNEYFDFEATRATRRRDHSPAARARSGSWPCRSGILS